MLSKNIYLPCFFLLFLTGLFAQKECTPDDLLRKIGKWQKTEDFFWTQKNYTASMRPEVFKRIDKIQTIFQDAYPKPQGTEVKWKHQVFGKPPVPKSNLVSYSFWALALEYGCNAISHQPVLEDETSNDLYAFVNNFNGYISFDTTLQVGNLYAALMAYRVGKIKDADLFQTDMVRIDQRFIIISRSGQLPYIVLTRKQYLAALKLKFEREKQSQLDRELPYRKTDADKVKLIDYINRGFDPKLKAISDYLSAHNEQDLSQPAFVKNAYETKFAEEKDGGRMYVVLNMGYFNLSLAGYIPQFMLVVWKWNDGEGPRGGLLRPVAPDMNVCCKVSKFFKESIENNLSIESLRQLIDK